MTQEKFDNLTEEVLIKLFDRCDIYSNQFTLNTDLIQIIVDKYLENYEEDNYTHESSKVFTENGFKPISEIRGGDKVLTISNDSYYSLQTVVGVRERSKDMEKSLGRVDYCGGSCIVTARTRFLRHDLEATNQLNDLTFLKTLDGSANVKGLNFVNPNSEFFTPLEKLTKGRFLGLKIENNNNYLVSTEGKAVFIKGLLLRKKEEQK